MVQALLPAADISSAELIYVPAADVHKSSIQDASHKCFVPILIGDLL